MSDTEKINMLTSQLNKQAERLDKTTSQLFYWKNVAKKYAIEKAELQERLDVANRELFELRSKSLR